MDEAALRKRIEAVRSGALPRREFIAQLAGLGITAPLASLMLTHAGVARAQPAFSYKPTKRGGGGVLKLLFWQAPTLLNPHFATGAKDQEAARVFYEALARYDADANLEPLLAAAIPSGANGGIAPDGRWTIWTLKKGVTWHDGKPFSADDVIFNWQYATEPAAAAFTSGQYENVAAIEKIDTHTVRIVFKTPTPLWQRTATVLLVPKHHFEGYTGAKSRDAPANLAPVGTGPYRFVEFRPGDLLRAQASPTFREANKPHFDSLEIKGGGDPTSAARAVLQTGEYDYGWNLQVEDEVLKRLESGGKGRIVASASGDAEIIILNLADPWTETDGERAHPKSHHPVLSQRPVRQALALLFDRASVQRYVYGRAGVATANYLNNPTRFNSPNQKSEFSIAKANALLDAAGWKRGADGMREKGGRKFALVFQTSINPVRQKVQAIFKQACGKAGIAVELKTVTASVFFSSDAGNPDTYGKFWADLEMYASAARQPDPDRYMQSWVSWEASSKANKWLGVNRSRWLNDDYDAAFRAATGELDPVKRAVRFIRMNDLVCSDFALIPVVYRPSVHGLANKLAAPLTGWDLGLAALEDWHRRA